MSLSTKEQKQRLRKEFKALRKQLSNTDVADRSEKLVRLLIQQINWSEIKTMHCFLPIVGSNEPDMRGLIKYASDHGVDTHTSLPNKPIHQTKDLQPKTFLLGDDTRFDLIIIPMLAYDPATKHRLGFGGGFYDCLLVSQQSALLVGVCFKEFQVSNLPIEPHDQPLQKIFEV